MRICRSAHEADAAAGEGDLGGGCEHGDRVFGTRGFGQRQDRRQPRRRERKIMNGVGVVPEYEEGLLAVAGMAARQVREASNGFLGIDAAGWIRVLGNAPDAAHVRIVLHEILGHVHVRAGIRHRHGHKFHAHGIGEGEMAVVSGHRTQALDPAGVAPRCPGETHVHRRVEDEEHQREARVAAGDHLFRCYVEQSGAQGAGLGQTPQHPVVAHVRAVLGHVVATEVAVEFIGEVELLRRRLAAGEVQTQVRSLEGIETSLQVLPCRHAFAPSQSPAVSGRPSIRLRFCTAAPAAPLPRLS